MFRIRLFGLDILGCKEALERLDDYVDRELNAEETRKVRQHLRICHECARKFAFEESFVAGVRDKAQKVALPSDLHAFKARIAQRLQQERFRDGDETGSNVPDAPTS